jgi:pseudaminic acid biosynthesis-associated methylase
VKRDTPQIAQWADAFGQAYTSRNPHSPGEQDALYLRNYGVSRTALNEEFLAPLDRSTRILEVGCNMGVQLMGLQRLGFTRLYGIKVQSYALQLTEGIALVCGSALEIPFRAASFDLVFTSGVLIHISPDDMGGVMTEIHRCSRRYLWGFEYFAEEHTPIPYRGNENLMWKADFAGLYRQRFTGLALVKKRRLPHLTNDNIDSMFLFEKHSEGGGG